MAQSREEISAGIQRKLSDLPDEARSLLASALPRLQILQEDRWSKLAEFALEGSFSGYAFDPAKAGEELGVSVDDARLLFNAAGFLTAISTVFGDADASVIIETLIGVDILTPQSGGEILRFVGFLIENRESITEDYERSALANSVLPTLQRFDTNVDLRLSKATAKRIRTAPVVVACVDTDAEGQIIWFQMSKGQVKRIMTQLEGVLKQLELAESISGKFEEADQDRGGE
ncbi:hypothetical protein [Achromobacter anxifer]|uniref:hypothetical protein n=1 Tax=Achromobacter anxifer TaxID=1287737 RepID=UPI0021573848|nr:hypothetical protein [Achromobacter anxifer]